MTNIEELHRDLDRAKEEIAGPVPTIEAAPDCLITLPRGIIRGGKAHARVEVRELTGNDEEALARYKKPEEVFDAVLALGTVRVGEVDLSTLPLAERQALLRQLLIGEREILFIAIAAATYGTDRRFPVTCDVCGREQELGVKLPDDFPPREVEGLSERSSFIFVTSKGLRLEVRLATGADQLALLAREGISLAEMNTIMLTACVVGVNDGVIVDPPTFARDLPMRDRQALVEEIIKRQPSPNPTITFPCHGCQEEQQVTFAWLDFFRL